MSLEPFFKPKSVAVVGASKQPRKFGHVIFKNFVESECARGFKAYPTVKEVPNELDLVIIAVPASAVPSIVDECVSKEVKTAVIISGGFKEVGEKERNLN